MQEYLIYSCTPMYRFISLRNAGDFTSKLTQSMLKVTCPTFLQAAVHLCVVQDAHRYSAVVVKSYEPYSSSGRNALCVVQDAHRCCAVVVGTQLTFVPKQKYATNGAAAPNSGDASTKTPEACATLKSRLKTYQESPKTRSQLDAKAGAAGC